MFSNRNATKLFWTYLTVSDIALFVKDVHNSSQELARVYTICKLNAQKIKSLTVFLVAICVWKFMLSHLFEFNSANTVSSYHGIHNEKNCQTRVHTIRKLNIAHRNLLMCFFWIVLTRKIPLLICWPFFVFLGCENKVNALYHRIVFVKQGCTQCAK